MLSTVGLAVARHLPIGPTGLLFSHHQVDQPSLLYMAASAFRKAEGSKHGFADISQISDASHLHCWSIDPGKFLTKTSISEGGSTQGHGSRKGKNLWPFLQLTTGEVDGLISFVFQNRTEVPTIVIANPANTATGSFSAASDTSGHANVTTSPTNPTSPTSAAVMVPPVPSCEDVAGFAQK